jgi:hypothetical protein
LKKSITESKMFRVYMFLWGMFVIGILIAFAFGKTLGQWRYIALVGFLLSVGSFIFSIIIDSSVQGENKARYHIATNQEKRFLLILFEFIRGIYLLMGISILLISYSQKNIHNSEIVEIGGKISNIEVIGQNNSSLKIAIDNYSNQYGSHTFKIPNEKLRQIEKEIKVGDYVLILIGDSDINARNDKYVQIYGIRTENKIYLSFDEYNRAVSANNIYGYIFGIFFTAGGLIYVLTGRIETNQD